MPVSPMTWLWLCLTALAAGMMNSIAGGGTLLTFPALLLVVSPVTANATSTVALVPGSLAGTWGYRREFGKVRRWAILLAGPSLLGGGVGSYLVAQLPEESFKVLVPWLILTAALLFLLQPTLARLTGVGRPHAPPSAWTLGGAMLFQFLVAVYGGYFGAGIGILMLSSLGLMGISDIHHMNALKTFLATCINGVAVTVFVLKGKVDWPLALSMALVAIVGGYLGARLARNMPRHIVRWLVVAIGFGLATYYFVEQARTSG
jgi:uncharacterized membrane protein YfcA